MIDGIKSWQKTKALIFILLYLETTELLNESEQLISSTTHILAQLSAPLDKPGQEINFTVKLKLLLLRLAVIIKFFPPAIYVIS